MRCDQCNKFAAYDDSTEPEVETDFNEESGTFSGQVRIVLTHDECGTELKEASFEFDGEVPKEIIAEHEGDDHSLSLEETSELTSRGEGSGRYMKTFYGHSTTIDLVCSCGSEGLWSQGFEDDTQASHMDELV